MFLIIYLERIIATEEDSSPRNSATPTATGRPRCRPSFRELTGWRAPELPFSFRNVLRREYSGLFAIIAVFFVLDQSREFLAESKTAIDPDWLAALACGRVRLCAPALGEEADELA